MLDTIPDHCRHLPTWAVALVVGWTVTRGLVAADVPPSTDAPVLTRLFFQDRATKSLKWADVRKGLLPEIGTVGTVDGFAPLDPTRHELVQMDAVGGLLLVGIRDNTNGTFGSGWQLVDTGVSIEDHGDHDHTAYRRPPRVIDGRLDEKQGNPAHLYVYDGVFYLANDRLNGYTRLDPSAYSIADDGSVANGTPQFIPGGGNHITLAVVGGRVGYATWVDGGGPNVGRIDITRFDSPAPAISRSFTLPSGNLHGATACGDKVFFAPRDGVCWVTADLDGGASADSPAIGHLDLGKHADGKTVRTGAFVAVAGHVLFTTGHGPESAFHVVDARGTEPSRISLPLPVEAGSSPVSAEVALGSKGKRYAFVFHNSPADVDLADKLTVVDLDPNRDGTFADAAIATTMPVGKSKVDGHYGHNALTVDMDRRRAYVTNPGDGTITVLALSDFEPRATFAVGGMPTAIVAVGGEEHGE